MINAVSSLSTVGEAAAVPVTPRTAAVPQVDFADVLADVSTNAMATLKTGEAAGIAGIQGKASVQQVVEAIMSAEQTLQTALAIRDKVVSAYQEISRMAV